MPHCGQPECLRHEWCHCPCPQCEAARISGRITPEAGSCPDCTRDLQKSALKKILRSTDDSAAFLHSPWETERIRKALESLEEEPVS